MTKENFFLYRMTAIIAQFESNCAGPLAKEMKNSASRRFQGKPAGKPEQRICYRPIFFTMRSAKMP